MVILNEIPDLRRYFCAIPSHDQHLTNGPISLELVSCFNHTGRPGQDGFGHEALSERGEMGKKGSGTSYQSRFCHSGSSSLSDLVILRSYRYNLMFD